MKPYYSDEAVTIYHGDCREILPALEKVDHVITDPPYDEETHTGARFGDYGRDGNKIDFDPLDVEGSIPALLAVASRWVVCFCSMEMLGDYRRRSAQSWIRSGFWRRSNGAPQFTGDRPGQPGDGIAIMHPIGKKRWNGGGRHAYYECGVERVDRVHPAQKPLALMKALVEDFTDPGETVLDPFMGSGTTLRAAKDLGRRAVGIELQERYCEIAAKRMSQMTLFGAGIAHHLWCQEHGKYWADSASEPCPKCPPRTLFDGVEQA